jgi:hypothetical protein
MNQEQIQAIAQAVAVAVAQALSQFASDHPTEREQELETENDHLRAKLEQVEAERDRYKEKLDRVRAITQDESDKAITDAGRQPVGANAEERSTQSTGEVEAVTPLARSESKSLPPFLEAQFKRLSEVAKSEIGLKLALLDAEFRLAYNQFYQGIKAPIPVGGFTKEHLQQLVADNPFSITQKTQIDIQEETYAISEPNISTNGKRFNQ